MCQSVIACIINITSEKYIPEATKPEGLSPEVIREIEEKILGITYED